MPTQNTNRILTFIIIISTFIRGYLAWWCELGNDEVYYWTYALFPDLSHFDHPPMVGIIIQIFTLNLLFDHEFFIRLGSVILMSLNTWIVYLIGEKIKDKITGIYSALLFNTSGYGFIITGVFMLPDTPQMFFWLLSIYFLTQSLTSESITKKAKVSLLWLGLLIGLGMISKYTTVFIWLGVFLYILIFDKRWFRIKSLYLSVFISLMVFTPVIYWNIKNDFISFTFQGGRLHFLDTAIRFDYLFMEIFGQFFYNNPVNFIIIIAALLALLKTKTDENRSFIRLILMIAIPLILVFIFFSLFRRTLPHWSAPGYTSLIFIAALYLRKKQTEKISKSLIPKSIFIAGSLLFLVIILGYLQISSGIINFNGREKIDSVNLGRKDITLDIFGWKQTGKEFSELIKHNHGENRMIISHRWFPAANLDYYVARPNHIKLLAIGPLTDIHKYYWINKKRGGFQLGTNAYYLTTSHDYLHPDEVFKPYFDTILPLDTLHIMRGKKHVMNVFVYEMNNLKLIPQVKLK
jgi:4-amino-4-deoxy-L-arabinose transferase-like glycosyltransferase